MTRLGLLGLVLALTATTPASATRRAKSLTLSPESSSQPRTAMRVRFDRFGLADRRRPRQAPYLRGSGLSITAVAPAAVDLTNPIQDFEATVDLPDAELPDLRVYDALLPAEAGLQLLGGRGVMAGSVVEHLYRAVRPLRIYEGTSEIQRMIIGKALAQGAGHGGST